jgi:hypothetical protein
VEYTLNWLDEKGCVPTTCCETFTEFCFNVTTFDADDECANSKLLAPSVILSPRDLKQLKQKNAGEN